MITLQATAGPAAVESEIVEGIGIVDGTFDVHPLHQTTGIVMCVNVRAVLTQVSNV